MKRVFITGISGYIAGRLAKALLDHEAVETVAGIDIREPDPKALASDQPGFSFYKRDVRDDVSDILERHGIDTIVHTAWILPPNHNTSYMEDINVTGTMNILKAAKQSNVHQVLYTSSGTAYGMHPDNDVPLTEDSSLRGNDDFIYAKNKKEMERVFAVFDKDNPQICVTILRPCYVAGPGLDNPLSTHLKKRFVPLLNHTAPFQYVHEDDLVKIMMLCLEQNYEGAFNVAGEGTMSFPQMVRMLGNTPVLLPERLVRVINGLAWLLRLKGLTEFPNSALSIMQHSWVMSCDKLIRKTGFKFEYNTLEAFKDFAAHTLAGKENNK